MQNFSKLKTTLIAALCVTMTCGTISAQDTDLSAQRNEALQFLPVNGEKIDHNGIIVNPTPHEITLRQNNGALDVSAGISIDDKKHKFSGDVAFAGQFGDDPVKLTIDFGKKLAKKAGIEPISGAYALTIDSNGITVTGYDETGAFYGLQTLRQVIESPASKNGKQLPYMTVRDYPSLPMRGLVEGFYGTPWSHEVRLSLIDFLGRHKMNTYVYGPKDDPYHSSPNWRLPYPDAEARQIKELVQACRRNRVNFVWAIHPGKDIRWDEEDYGNLLHKFELMYDLGVRQFAIFFDDISGKGTSPAEQTALLNRLDKEFVQGKGDVASLILCPTDYNRSWANPTPQGSLPYFGGHLNKGIEIFWTGDAVCSDLTASTLEWVNSRIGRPALFWWNYPVTDYVRNVVLQGPVYGLDTTLTSQSVSGLLSNPMEHGEASKLALYGVADYAWNIAAYNPIDNWERALHEMAPEAAEAYRTFAIHSCDTRIGYRRDESWETATFGIDDYSAAKAEALHNEFERIELVPQQMEEGCNNAQLLNELRPWLTEFGKLGTRGKRAVELIEMFLGGSDDAAFWEKYAGNLMSSDDCKSYEAHKTGTMKLQPFYENAMSDLAHRFIKRLSGKTPCDYRPLTSFTYSSAGLLQFMLDGDTATYYTSGVPQRSGSWVAVDLGRVQDVSSVCILQGRNHTDTVNCFNHAALEYSADGKTWTPLIGDTGNKTEINWAGNPVKARFVRLKNLGSDKKGEHSIRSFNVNMPTPASLGFDVQTHGGDTRQAMQAFDLNAATAYALNGTMTIMVSAGSTGCTILMKSLETPGLAVSMLDTSGKELQRATTPSLMGTVSFPPGTASVEISGTATIVEIILNR